MQTSMNIHSGLKVWSDEQIYEIHKASLEILENTGVMVYDDEAVKLLKDGGAFVDGERVRIPAAMVEAAIKSAPSKITFCGVDKSRAMHLYRDNVYYGLGTDLPVFVDPYSGEIRDTVLKDVEDAAKVAQYADNIDFVASLGLALDMPQELVDLYHLKASRTYCNKPNWVTATDYGNMKALIDMAAVNAGGYEELRRCPSIGLYAEPISPLVNSKEAVQKLLLCAEYGVPVTYASGIIAGATGPATLAGTIALGNAEGLAGLVMHQLKREGAPFIFGIVTSIIDMATTINLYGGPEQPLMHAAVGQLGKFYNLPSYGTGGCTDANTVDAQAGIEAMMSNVVAGLSGTNLVHDNGYLGSGLCGSLEMILLDDETAGFTKRLVRGIAVNDESLALDVIHEVGPGGEFLTQMHTFDHFRTENYFPKYMNKRQYIDWTNEGKLTMADRLNAKVKKIIESEYEVRLTDGVLAAYDEIIARRKQEIAEGKFHREHFE